MAVPPPLSGYQKSAPVSAARQHKYYTIVPENVVVKHWTQISCILRIYKHKKIRYDEARKEIQAQTQAKAQKQGQTQAQTQTQEHPNLPIERTDSNVRVGCRTALF